MKTRSLVACLVLSLTMVACGLGTGELSTPAQSAPNEQASPTGTAQGSPAASGQVERLNLEAIVIPPQSPPIGMTSSSAGEGRGVLDRLPLFPDTAVQLRAVPGFVDGAYSDFSGSSGFILTWVVQYASLDDAMAAVSILLNELQSDDRYGWGIGEEAGLGDEGTCLEGDNPREGGLHETICVWRNGPLVMAVGGGSENETPIEAEAEAMDARADALIP